MAKLPLSINYHQLLTCLTIDHLFLTTIYHELLTINLSITNHFQPILNHSPMMGGTVHGQFVAFEMRCPVLAEQAT